MALAGNGVTTTAGLDMISSAVAGDQLVFTRAEWGDGTLPGGSDPRERTSLVSKVGDASITSVTHQDGAKAVVTTLVSNEGLVTATDLREIGVYAKVGSGPEKLFGYVNAGATCDTAPPELSGPYTKYVQNVLVVSDELTVTATLDDTVVATELYKLKSSDAFAGFDPMAVRQVPEGPGLVNWRSGPINGPGVIPVVKLSDGPVDLHDLWAPATYIVDTDGVGIIDSPITTTRAVVENRELSVLSNGFYRGVQVFTGTQLNRSRYQQWCREYTVNAYGDSAIFAVWSALSPLVDLPQDLSQIDPNVPVGTIGTKSGSGQLCVRRSTGWSAIDDEDTGWLPITLASGWGFSITGPAARVKGGILYTRGLLTPPATAPPVQTYHPIATLPAECAEKAGVNRWVDFGQSNNSTHGRMSVQGNTISLFMFSWAATSGYVPLPACWGPVD